jgi:D-cysteine desulfhydrase family pyridoxal phosphate-dependent enzyme
LDAKELHQRLDGFARLDFGDYPTPLARLDRLSARLGGPEVWVKRDDGLGPGMGGNKTRKLAYLLAEALQQGKRKVVTYGGLQSNHARITAAACASLGLEAHLIFFERRPDRLDGNLLLDRLFGARLHFFPFGGGSSSNMSLETVIRLVKVAALPLAGRSAYYIPGGGHNVLGCLGYVKCALELHQQVAEAGLLQRPLTLVTACGTGGTLAGLMAGLALLDSPVQVLGIDVGKLWKGFPASIARLASDICLTLGSPRRFGAADVPLIEGRYVGPGYALATAAGQRAMEMTAGSEGILLDPIYTGKAMAGLMDLIEQGRFAAGERVIFLHTGGEPGLWSEDRSVS